MEIQGAFKSTRQDHHHRTDIHTHTIQVAPQSFTNTTQINTALQKVKSLKLQLDQAVTAKRHARSLSMTPKERLKDALDRDDVTELSDIVSTNTHLDLFKLFDSAAQEKALRCLSWLLKQEEVDWTRPLPHSFYAQSLFHRLVSKSNDDSTVLNHCVSELGAGKAKELGLALDAVGRRPLHYAAFWGFPNMTRVLLSVSSDSLNEDGWADHDGHTPLYLAVMKGFDKVVSELVAMPGWKKWDGFGSASALIMACSFGHVSIVKLLLDKGVDVTAVNEEGENALHVASIHGHHDVVKLLLLSAPHPSYINCKDIYFGRTPLFLAAMKGHLKVVQILLEHQAVVDVTDSTGRNPHEHAVYRGHQVIAKLLKPFIEPYPSKPVASPTKLMDTNDKIISERAYGQEVQTQTLLHVYIGSTDKRYPLPPVFLNESLLPKEKTFGAYSLVVSCTGAEIMVGNTVVDHKLFRFPITDTGSSLNEPLVLQTTDHKKVVIQFDVAPIQDTFHPVHWKPLARATLMLSSPKDPLWLEQKPAGGRYFVPLICSTTMNKIGHLTSEVVVVTPYNHPNDDAGLGITRYWKSLVTKVY